MGSSQRSRERTNKKKWEKIKNNPELHKKHNERIKEYRKKNRDKINKRTKERWREMKELAIELGSCSICFKEKENPKYKTCLNCRKYHREYFRKHRK